MNASAFVRTIAESITTADIYQSRRQREREARHFERVQRASAQYTAKLRRIARHVGEIINAYPPGDAAGVAEVQRYLQQYANILRPWARQAGLLMLAQVARRDETAWFNHAKMLGRYLKRDVLRAGEPTADEVKRILDEQVELITSIPLEAAEDVQKWSREYWVEGIRYDELRQKIYGMSGVTWNRATLIARTETAKTSSAVTQARAAHLGSTHYIWHSVRDADVRPMHKKLDGTIQAWDAPPIAEENDERHHPGQFPNCRCFAEPILPPPVYT